MPNTVSLEEARRNFQEHGAADPSLELVQGEVETFVPARSSSRRRIAVGIFMMLGVIALCLQLLLVVLVIRPVALLGVKRGALEYSIENEVGGFFMHGDDSCQSRGHGRYRCMVREPSGSGVGLYDAKIDPKGCWRARLVLEGAEGLIPEQPHDCLGIWDYVALGRRG